MSDKELIDEIRDGHTRQDRREGEPPMCLACSPVDWPCDAVRAADALEAATEGDYHEGLEEGIKIGRAERDAAVAAIERVRDVAMKHRSVEQHNEMVPVTDIADLIREPSSADYLAALDGAPEPEWEYRARTDYGRVVAQGSLDEIGYLSGHIWERRRKADPWLPVEGESKP